MKKDLDLRGMDAGKLADALIMEVADAVSLRQVASAKAAMTSLLQRWLILNKEDTDIVQNMSALADKYEKQVTLIAPDVVKAIRAILNPPCLHPADEIEVQEVGKSPLFVCGSCGKRLKLKEYEWV